MKKLVLAAIPLIIAALLFAPALTKADNLPQNCIEFKEVKFSYIPKNNYKFGGQKVWLQFTNNCGVDLDVDNFTLIGHTTNDANKQNWTVNFGVALLPVKAGAVGTTASQYKANDAALMKIIIKKDSTILAEKIFEPKDFDKMRAATQQKSKALDKSPVQPKNLPNLK